VEDGDDGVVLSKVSRETLTNCNFLFLMVISSTFGQDITQAIKSLIGGGLKAYTEMMNEAR